MKCASFCPYIFNLEAYGEEWRSRRVNWSVNIFSGSTQEPTTLNSLCKPSTGTKGHPLDSQLGLRQGVCLWVIFRPFVLSLLVPFLLTVGDRAGQSKVYVTKVPILSVQAPTVLVQGPVCRQ